MDCIVFVINIFDKIWNYKMIRIEKAKNFTDDYFETIRPLVQDAKKVCQKWTNTPCNEATEVLILLEKYSKIRTLDKNGKELNLTESECKEYQILENFRRKTITFWCNVQEHDYVLPYLFYPNLGEIKEFMTFHWALYMTNNKCTELPNYLGEEPNCTYIPERNIT